MAPADDRTGPHGAMTRLAQAIGRADDPGIPAPPRDGLSFLVFYRARRGRMIGLVRMLAAGDVTDLEEVAQEGWCRFYRHWEGCAYPDAYLRQCMASAVSDARRKAAAEPRTCGLDAASASPAGGPPARDDGLEEPPWDPELTRALRRLSPKLREFVLLEVELNPGERSVAEIARILGIGRTAAYGRKMRAYRKLRQLLPVGYPELRAAGQPGRSSAGRSSAEGWSNP
jgi:DNA-directed RNA polymerase specialized sigma24 family protein